jgi:Bacterial PH domain
MTTYKGRNDLWFIASFALATAALLFTGNYWIGGPLLLVFTLCVLPQTYQVASDGVHIRAGLVRRFIPYSVITFVGPCGGGQNLALTLDGVCLRYGLNSEIRIAPADAPGFIADVASRTPHLVKRGTNLVLTLA